MYLGGKKKLISICALKTKKKFTIGASWQKWNVYDFRKLANIRANGSH